MGPRPVKCGPNGWVDEQRKKEGRRKGQANKSAMSAAKRSGIIKVITTTIATTRTTIENAAKQNKTIENYKITKGAWQSIAQNLFMYARILRQSDTHTHIYIKRERLFVLFGVRVTYCQ